MLRLVISKVPIATTELWGCKNTKVAIYSIEIIGYCGVFKNCMETEFNFQIISTWWKIFFFKFSPIHLKTQKSLLICGLYKTSEQATFGLKALACHLYDYSGERPRWGARQRADAFSSQRRAILGTSLVAQLVKTPHFHCREGLGSIPAQGTKIPKCNAVKMLRGEKKMQNTLFSCRKI